MGEEENRVPQFNQSQANGQPEHISSVPFIWSAEWVLYSVK